MRSRSLTGRIVATTVAVALVAVLAVSVVGFQLVRQESIGQTRQVLLATAQALAAAPAGQRAAFAARVERRSKGRIDLGSGGDGAVGGVVTSLPSGLEARLTTTDRLSVRQVDGWRTLLVEAVPARGGGSVVAVEDVSVLHADTVLARFAVALLIGVLVAMVLGVLVARYVTRPLRGVSAIAARLASGERGVLAERGPSDGRIAEVTEIADVQRALALLDRELARSEAAQREFLTSISHEFRTPLAAVRGYADALADGLVPVDETARVGTVVRAETERLDAFVADLLTLARLEADDFPVRRGLVDVVQVVSESVRAWEGRAATVGARVGAESHVAEAVTRTDPLRLRQVVDGLVENALRVARPGGQVVVRVGDEPAGVVVEVADDGPGIAVEDLHRAFVRGALRDRHRDERPVGTGLGLSIAARLVDRLGGRITAVPVERGACFRVVLLRDARLPQRPTSAP
ncbi:MULTISPECIES: ATP-binding protein [Curtobacterium]|uniref:sensor histidine kinase n=1 Tax=Curtobacterium flaccumfaciens TaxID=2035 RepID=UPI003EE44F6C